MTDGNGILCAGLDVESGGEENFLEWHTREHLVERLGLPGFLRGRRFAALGEGPAFFILYEVEDLSVLSSPDYLACLNNPTPWTQRTIGSFRNGFRSACRVAFSGGAAEGGFILVLRFSPKDPDKVRRELGDGMLSGLLPRPGITRVRFALPDRSSSTIDTVESRKSGNVFVDEWVLLVEAVSEQSLSALLETELSGERLRCCGVESPVSTGIFQLQARVEKGGAA